METGLHISLAAEKVFEIGGFDVTNSMVNSVLVSAFLILIGLVSRLVISSRPKGFYNFVEMIVDSILGLMDQVMGSRKDSLRYFPLLATLFLYIVLNNYSGLLPGVGSIQYNGVHLFRGGTADLNTTFALAIVAIVAIQYYGMRSLGVFNHLGKYFTIKNPIFTFVGLLEVVSELSRALSLSFRLFGNIFAGEVLLAVMAFLAPILAPLPFYGLELFVGLVQALVFFMLTMVFLKIATEHHSEAH